MDGNRNAMYTQAGRSRGWTRGINNDDTDVKIQAETTIVQENVEIGLAPVIPVVPPVTEPPMVDLPAVQQYGDCQEVGMAYVAMQKWQELYEPEQGFHRGTIFGELDLPFVGEGACRYE